MLNTIQQGIFTPSTKQRLEELEETKKDIETAIVCEKLQRPEITKPHIIHFITKFRNMDFDDLNSRKRLIDSFVNSIYLYDDKIVFVFNYNEEKHELTLKELESDWGFEFERIYSTTKRTPYKVSFLCVNGVLKNSRFIVSFAIPSLRSLRASEQNQSCFLIIILFSNSTIRLRSN